jgi:SAM-dependent methyltransferase
VEQDSLMSRVQRRVGRAVSSRNPAGWIGLLPRRQFFEFAYRAVLGRSADRGGVAHFEARLDAGMTRDEVLAALRDSAEAHALPAADEVTALHRCRQAFVRSFPAAGRILDLGGTDLNDARGALVTLGYPYSFDELVIVDLPADDRHESYASEEVGDVVESLLGPVRYRYHSMADLSGIDDDSFDLVYSGQTFEHVTPEDGHRVLDEARRVLHPGGYLCLDTPNRVVTALQLRGSGAQFIDPDHEVEYTDTQMLALFAEHGFEVQRAHGLGLMQHSVAQDRFDPDELKRSSGLYDDIAASYLLAYVCVAAS